MPHEGSGRGPGEDLNDANPLHKRVPAEAISRTRRVQAAVVDKEGPVSTDRKAVFLMKPDQRLKWLVKALLQAAQGVIRPSDLYDVISSQRFVEDVPFKVGKRMDGALREQLGLFSVKQQRFIEGECSIGKKFGEATKPTKHVESVPKEAKTETKSNGGGKAKDAGVAMEDMMARCRAFVREKQSERGEREASLGEPAPALGSGWTSIPSDKRPAEVHEFKVGDEVEAYFANAGSWYGATLEKENGDGSWTVKWFDDDENDRVKQPAEVRKKGSSSRSSGSTIALAGFEAPLKQASVPPAAGGAVAEKSEGKSERSASAASSAPPAKAKKRRKSKSKSKSPTKRKTSKSPTKRKEKEKKSKRHRDPKRHRRRSRSSSEAERESRSRSRSRKRRRD